MRGAPPCVGATPEVRRRCRREERVWPSKVLCGESPCPCLAACWGLPHSVVRTAVRRIEAVFPTSPLPPAQAQSSSIPLRNHLTTSALPWDAAQHTPLMAHPTPQPTRASPTACIMLRDYSESNALHHARGSLGDLTSGRHLRAGHAPVERVERLRRLLVERMRRAVKALRLSVPRATRHEDARRLARARGEGVAHDGVEGSARSEGLGDRLQQFALVLW